ncbi:MAG: hypothetical protein K8T90_05825 [Planctomycetes bacterium]|nr:hypothetical protein [Planctomycetota bacterium]
MITVEKPRAPSGRAYVLKTSMLELALADAGIDVQVDVHIDLHYHSPQVAGQVLSALYWLPNERVPYPRLYMGAGSVAARDRPAALAQFQAFGLPQFIRWLTMLRRLPENSPLLLSKPSLDASYEGGDLKVVCHPAP